MVAVGEALTAAWAKRAGVDIVGVGNSLGMTLHGHENALAMTVDQVVDHCKAVRRGAPNTLCIVSMPYGSYATRDMAVVNAIRLIKEGGAEAVKLQGGREVFDIIKAVADAGTTTGALRSMCRTCPTMLSRKPATVLWRPSMKINTCLK